MMWGFIRCCERCPGGGPHLQGNGQSKGDLLFSWVCGVSARDHMSEVMAKVKVICFLRCVEHQPRDGPHV